MVDPTSEPSVPWILLLNKGNLQILCLMAP